MSEAMAPVPRVLMFVLTFLGYPWLLLERWRGLLRPLETVLLREMIARLAPDLAAIAQSQLGEINHVQRVTARYTECNLFRVVPFRADRTRQRSFVFAKPEVTLARIRFRVDGFESSVKFWVVNGNLFSLEFNCDVRRYLGSGSIEVLNFRQVHPD